jgi:hypothetical protein
MSHLADFITPVEAEEWRVEWTTFENGHQARHEMTFFSTHSKDPKEDALAFADDLDEGDTTIGTEVGDIKVYKRQVTAWQEAGGK